MNRRDRELDEALVGACTRLESLVGSDDIIDPVVVESLMYEYSSLRDRAVNRSSGLLYSLGLVNGRLRKDLSRFMEVYGSFRETVSGSNADAAGKRAAEIGNRINPVEGRDLDPEQLAAIAYDVRTRLVVAGAGTGKTTTIVGLVKDLLSSGAATPEDVLVLSFTNSSVNELEGRIRRETGSSVAVMTFHRLALKVLAESGTDIPSVSRMDLRDFLVDEMVRRKSDPVYMRALNEYAVGFHGSVRDEGSFPNGSELVRYLRDNPLFTMNGERVKSFGESEIANYLAVNGIPYVYEEQYEIDTSDRGHGRYHPDFHISGTRIYIEYFGIDCQGNVAPFMIDDDPDASRRYLEGMEWKRGIHRENGTVLIELYAYNRSEGNLLEELGRRLGELGVDPEPVPPEVVFDRTFGGDMRRLRSLAAEFATTILLIKGSGRPWEDAYPRAAGLRDRHELAIAEAALRPLYHAYQSELSERHEMDFEDMLNMASRAIERGDYTHPYRYLVVDEYQDLSRSRYNLLLSMRRSRDYRLFCVGDDWQSIYRFNGCDVSYIIDFERYWGPSVVCGIGRTYRFSGELLRRSTDFMSHSAGQLPKNLRGSPSRDSGLHPLTASTEHGVRMEMARILSGMPRGRTVLFLGRYNHDVGILGADGFGWRPDIRDGSIVVRYDGRPDLDMRFMTIHSSKGLQADVVFSLNNRTGRYGFPARGDEPLPVRLLMDGGGGRRGEERRLFYVAMTRARDDAYIVTLTGQESDFFREVFPGECGGSGSVDRVCPLCGGMLVPRDGRYGRFYGCSNYASRGCRFTRRLDDADGSIRNSDVYKNTQ